MANISLEQLHLIALAAVEEPTWKDQYRGICRWYSREFHTPLKVVEEELDQLHVLMHYYEDSFEKLYRSDNEESRQKYEAIKEDALRSQMPEGELTQAEREDEEWEQQMLREIAEEEAKAKAQEKPVTKKDTLEKPNLEDEIEFSVQGEDGPPDF